MSSIEGAGGPSAAQYSTNALGKESLLGGGDGKLEDATQALQDRIGDLQQQIESTDDSQLEAELQQAIDGLEQQFDQIKSLVEAGSSAVESAVSDFMQSISESYSEYGTAEVSADASEAMLETPGLQAKAEYLDDVIPDMVQEKLGVGAERLVERLGQIETGEASQTDSTSGAEQTESASEEAGNPFDELGRDVDEMVNMMSNDPDAFMEEMGQLDVKDRSMAMQLIQQQLQEMNQMFQMMSQFSQAMHDTNKSIIQNMRV